MKKIKLISMGLAVWLLLYLVPVSFTQDNTCILTKNSIKTSELDTLNYLLYTPENATENMPLIVYLHGGSGKGDDLDLITSVEGFPKYVQDKRISDIPAYIIFPQLPSTKRGWPEIKVSVKELIEHVCATHSIDETRISLTGHSMGGTGTWNIALAYPETFSCIAPMSGSITNTSDNIDTLSKIPVWAFVGSADTIVPPDSSINFIADLKSKNKTAEITVFDEATHFDVPGLAYLDTNLDVVGWLLSNEKVCKTIKNSIKTSELNTFNYLMYTPENAAENMPLIVYLHGGSGKGNNLDLLTSVAGFPQYVNNGTIKDIPAYIIFPQVPSSKKGWPEVKTSVKELIDYISDTYTIDKTRISLTGHSMGGTGTWNIALAYPEIFSCIAPMSGSIDNTAENVSALSNTPVWAFVGSADTIVSPDASMNFIAALNEKNPYAKITIFADATHFDVPTLAYLDDKLDVVSWLIDNVREKEVIEFSSDIVTVNIEIPGKYTLILADYEENGRLNKIKFIEQEFKFGENKIMVPEDITLGINDKIMLWKKASNMQPLYKSYIIQ